MRLAILLALLPALLLGACGRRGSPEQPPLTGPTAPIDPVDPQSRQVPDRPFILDPML